DGVVLAPDIDRTAAASTARGGPTRLGASGAPVDLAVEQDAAVLLLDVDNRNEAAVGEAFGLGVRGGDVEAPAARREGERAAVSVDAHGICRERESIGLL